MNVRILLSLLVAVALPALASAQPGITLLPFVPKDCLSDAKKAVGGAAVNPRLVALINVGVQVPVGTDNIDVGIDTKDGKARFWYYVFIAGPADTVAPVAMVKVQISIVVACVDPATITGGGNPSIPIDELSKAPLPANYIEGSAFANALNGNSEYMRFKTANPDSQPGLAVLTTSTEDLLDFPRGTPIWFLTWTDLTGGGGGAVPFICIVHSVTGATLCGDQIVATVSEVNDASVFIAPNPVRDNALVNLPISWMGKQVTIEAVSTFGAVFELSSISALTSPVTTITTQALSSGAYTLRAHTSTEFIVLPMSVIR